MNLDDIYRDYVAWTEKLGLNSAAPPETHMKTTAGINPPPERQHRRYHRDPVPQELHVPKWGQGALLCCLLVLCSVFLQAQIPVIAQLTDGSGSVANAAFLHFELENCGNNFPVIASNPGLSQNPWTIVKTAFDLKANQPDGSILSQVLPNRGTAQILCGNVASTYYKVTAMKDASTPLSPVGGQPFVICDSGALPADPCSNPGGISWNPALQQPAFQPVAPGFVQIFGNSRLSQVVNQPPGTSLNFFGAFNFNNGLTTGPIFFASLAGLAGLANIVYVSDASPSSSPCTGGGTGAFAFYVNGAWTCAIGSNSGPGGGTVTTVSGTTNQLQVSNGSTTPVISFVPNPTLPGNVTVTGTLNVSGASFSVFAQTFTGTVGNTGILPQRGAVSGTAISCFDASGNVTNVGCPPISPTAPGVATEVPFRNSGTGLLAADSSLFYNLLSHTLTVTNINVNGIMNWLNAFGVSSTIPTTSACIPAAGMAVLGVNTDGNFATSNNGSPCVDIAGSPVPTGVVKGSYLASNGASANPVYQSKSFLDVRDIAGVDCTGAADSAAALTAFTGNQPGTNNAITGKTLSFGSCPSIKLATTWVIYNQAGFIIDGFTRSGAASKGINFSWSGAANGVMIDCEYCDGFIMRGLNIQGNANAGVGIQIDKNGAGGIWNTTDGILTNNTYQGANQNWVGVLISPVSVQNVEDIRISDSAFYCNATVATTAGVGIKIGNSPNAKNEIIKHINVTNCLYGVWKINGSFQVLESEFSANGGTCATGSGADIRDDTNTDVDIIEGNLDENSLQGISFTAAQGHPVIVKGNHAAPAGCDNTSRYWFNTGTGSGSWLFDGNSWDPDSSLVKVIGTASGQTGQTIYTRGNLYPNSIFTPWWTLGVSAIGDDVQVSGENLLVYAGQTGGVLPQAGSNYPSPFQVFRGYLNGSLTADDFAEQFIPAGTAGSSGGTFLLKHQQGATGTEMFAFDGSYPGMTIAQIPTPAAPTITNTGAAGAVTDTYSVVAYGASGNTVGSSTGSTATANATLTTSNFNVIAFDSVPGAVKYCIWRTVAGGTPSTLGNIGCMSALQINFRFHSNVWGTAYANNNAGVRNHYLFNDTGLAGDSASLPASNTTGGLSVAGPLTITSTTRVSNLHTSGNPDLISCGGTTTCSNTRQVNGYTVYGSATLAAGTLAYAGLPFASTTWLCNTWDITTPGTTSSMVQVTDATHATITGTGTDVIGFQCMGN